MHHAARFADEDDAGGHVPRLQFTLPKAVKAAGGDIGEVKCGRPPAPHPGALRHQAGEVAQGGGQGLFGAERNAGGKDAVDHVATARDAQAAIVHPGTGALFGPEQFVLGRVIDHARDHFALVFQGNGDRPVRHAVQEIRRAIQRIDDPAPGGIGPGTQAGFLAQPAIGGTATHQLVLDDALGLGIGLGHEIAGALGGHLQVFHLAEILDEGTASLAGGLDHQVEVGAALHGASPKGSGPAGSGLAGSGLAGSGRGDTRGGGRREGRLKGPVEWGGSGRLGQLWKKIVNFVAIFTEGPLWLRVGSDQKGDP